MEPSAKNLVFLVLFGLTVVWGTFVAMELKSEDVGIKPYDRSSSEKQDGLLRTSKKRDDSTRPRLKTSGTTADKKATVRRTAPSIQQTSKQNGKRSTVQTPIVSDGPLPASKPHTSSSSSQLNHFAKLEKRYESEARDFSWASEKEKRIVEMFKRENREDILIDISCRKTVCKLEFNWKRPETLFNILLIPGLKDEIGSNAATKKASESSDKDVVVYFTK